MTTLTVDIQDSFVEDFLNFIKKSHNNIKVRQNGYFGDDKYYEERKEELKKIRNNIKENKENLYSIDEIERKINLFEKNIENKYAN